MLLAQWLAAAWFLASAANGQWTRPETTVISAIFHYFRCTFATLTTEDPTKESALAIRVLSQGGVAANFKTLRQTYDMISKTVPHEPTIVVVRPHQLAKAFQVYPPHKTPAKIGPGAVQRRLKRDRWLWMVVMRPGDEFPSPQVFIPFDVELVVLEPTHSGFTAWEQYHISQANKTNFLMRTKLGEWSEGRGLHDTPPASVHSPRNMYLRRDMRNTSVTVHSSPGISLPANFRKLVIPGTEVIAALHDIFHFKRVNTRDGYSKPDLSVYSLSMIHPTTPPIEQLKWFIGPLKLWQINLYYQRLDENPLVNFALRPFEDDVWACLVAWIAMAVIVVASLRCSRRRWTPGHDQQRAPMQSFFNVFAAFCGQGDGAEGAEAATRVTNLAIWATVTMVLATYSAIIFTFILTRESYRPFTDMAGFVKDGTYMYGGLNYTLHTIAHKLFPNDSPEAIAGRTMLVPNHKRTGLPSMGVKAICADPKMAFMGFGNHMEDEYWPCPLERMLHPYTKMTMAIGSQRMFPYTLALNSKVPLLWSSGVLNRIDREFTSIQRVRPEPELRAADLHLLQPLFVLLLAAAATSLVALALELLYHSHSKA